MACFFAVLIGCLHGLGPRAVEQVLEDFSTRLLA